MVLLVVTPAAHAAISDFCRVRKDDPDHEDQAGTEWRARLLHATTGSPIEHNELVRISCYLVQHARQNGDPTVQQWRLDSLLRGARVYIPTPPPKPEPAKTAEYKALMQRLREQEEQRQYDRMLRPAPQRETFSQRFPNASTSLGLDGAMSGEGHDIDEVTYADVNRQMILIMNVLVSIIACSVAIWMAARRWSIPQRLALSFSGSTVVAVAEVAIYMGYIRRIKEAKTTEAKAVERKEVVDTWVIDGSSKAAQSAANATLRFRKGKHR